MLPSQMPPKLKWIFDAYTAIEGRIAAVLLPLWTLLQNIWVIVKLTRFSAFTILAGVILLVFTAQGSELAARIGEEDYLDISILLASVIWLAFQSWYWARIALYFEYGIDREKWPEDWKAWIAFTPRFYAGAAFGAAAGAFVLTSNYFVAAIFAAAGVVFFLLLTYRTKVFAKPNARMVRGKTKRARLRGFGDLPRKSFAVLVGSISIALVAMIWISFSPVYTGQKLGATAAAFFAFGNIIPIGSFLIIRSREIGLPVITILLVYAVAISPWVDNHEVPTLGNGLAPRLTVEAAFNNWFEAQTEKTEKPLPIVFISTAGGGLRAAYWTATVLGRIQDICPGFAARTFSISGVSGGSVGAVVFAARQAEHGVRAGSICPEGAVKKLNPAANGDEAFMQEVLSQDFLGPTIAAFLFPDLLQRFNFFSLLSQKFNLPDRGTALSLSWEAGWATACKNLKTCDENGPDLGSAFLDAGPRPGGKVWRPVLLLNGTHQETGKRIITSHVEVTGDTFFDALDMQYLLGGDMTLATAALNSARFTYVSPAGRLIAAGEGEDKEKGHVLDGGYFENYGAVATSELLTKITGIARDKKRKIRPIVIQISSDPKLKESDYPKQNKYFQELKLESKFQLFANEITGPIRGLMNTRGARGVLANKTVAEFVRTLNANALEKAPEEEKAVFAHFSLCEYADNGPPPPLGWAMSNDSQKNIRGLLENTKKCSSGYDNVGELKKIIEALSGLKAG